MFAARCVATAWEAAFAGDVEIIVSHVALEHAALGLPGWCSALDA